jgi:methylaspartate mutase sigma subunit
VSQFENSALTLAEDAGVRGRRKTVVVTSMASDSHTWNLVYLQLLIEELGYDVANLGPCVPDDILVSECQALSPEMVVISSVNGHGYQDGLRVIGRLRSCEQLTTTPVVIGGMLGISAEDNVRYFDELLSAGFNHVFEGSASTAGFRTFVGALRNTDAAPAGLAAIAI